MDLVTSVGGAGTVLGTPSRGVPTVLMPVAADQTWTSERPAAPGPAAVVGAPDRVGGAVGGVTGDPPYRGSAAAIAGRMAETNPPEEALRLPIARTSGTAGPSQRSGSTAASSATPPATGAPSGGRRRRG